MSTTTTGPSGSRPENAIDWQGVTGEGEPLAEVHVLASLNRSRAVLIGLDLIAVTSGTWSAGPSARWLLARATALAHLWTTTAAP
ncbi:MAG: hypothetical protein ACRDYY_10385 [Acidimicrobiales bacterium]